MKQRHPLAQKRFAANAYQLKEIRQLVSEAMKHAGGTAEEMTQVVIAVNEACMNIIQHAYKNDPCGEIVVEILIDGSNFLCRITDFAEHIDPGKITARDLAIVRPGGLGVPLINAVMDKVTYKHRQGGVGNILEMTKRIQSLMTQ